MNLHPKTDLYIIPETDDFLGLWPHRYDYIYSPHGFKPEWRTESRHPLGDRLIMEGLYHFGVRFGGSTEYVMLDIDAHSPYHPNQDPLAIGRILAALESSGLIAHLACTSSYSGGLHLYFPWVGQLKTYVVSNAIDALLRTAGFSIEGGKLEIFPNRKGSAAANYHAHRLPMGHGSYLMNASFEVIAGEREDFARRWHFAAGRNDVTAPNLQAIAKRLQRSEYKLTKSSLKFLGDLDAEIEPGWTGQGQTNKLLGRIAMRGYIFGHICEGDQVLEGRNLVRYICQTARSLPGFDEWCRHRHELEKKAEFWARSVQASPRYFPYAIGKSSKPGEFDRSPGGYEGNAWNILQMQIARLKIRDAIAVLLEDGILAVGIRDRLEQLMMAGLSADTLYRHRDLWHPEVMEPDPENPPMIATSLLPPIGWINPRGKGYSLYLAKQAYKQGGSTFLSGLLGGSPGD
jgi:hypothetical protein